MTDDEENAALIKSAFDVFAEADWAINQCATPARASYIAIALLTIMHHVRSGASLDVVTAQCAETVRWLMRDPTMRNLIGEMQRATDAKRKAGGHDDE